MLLDKNPRTGFLSPHAPAGAARPRADCPGFPARLQTRLRRRTRQRGPFPGRRRTGGRKRRTRRGSGSVTRAGSGDREGI